MKEQDYQRYLNNIEQANNMIARILSLEKQFGFFKANFVEKEKQDHGKPETVTTSRGGGRGKE